MNVSGEGAIAGAPNPVAASAGTDNRPRIGRYETLGRIGVGGMAEVFHARATGPGTYTRDLIIKSILPSFASDPDFVRAFVDEAKILGLLNHPNIVGMYDFGEDGGRHYLALEYLDGATLSLILARARKSKAPLPVWFATFVAREICRGLTAVHGLCLPNGQHMNVVHRDVTPSNVIITKTGAVKLLDFGIAKIGNERNVTRTGHIKGKVGYLAPEQILGGAVDGRVDLFAVGIVVYEMLRLEPLFHGEGGDVAAMYRTLEKPIEPPSSFRDDVSPAFDALVMKALSREPAKRYQSAEDMEHDLDAAFHGSKGDTKSAAADVAKLLLEL